MVAYAADTEHAGTLEAGDPSTNVASGTYSAAFGSSTTASDINSAAFGHLTTASGRYSTAFGYSTTANGDYSTAFGQFATAQPYTSFVIGQYNEISGTTNSWIDTDPLFVIGNGADADNPNNAVTVLKNGNIGIGTSSPVSALQVSGYIQLDTSSGLPPTEDCDSTDEIGRMKLDDTNRNLYVCVNTQSGIHWITANL